MTISDEKTLRDIQKEFNIYFPYLKIEFYSGHHARGEGSPVQDRLDPELPLSVVRTIHTTGDLKIDPEKKVSEFEQMFYAGLLCDEHTDRNVVELERDVEKMNEQWQFAATYYGR